MARTLAQIKSEIETAVQTNTNLMSLTSESQVAVYHLWVGLIADVIHTQSDLFEAYKRELEQKVLENSWGILEWYVAMAKKFQYGDAVEQLPNNQPYGVIDTTKQIVTLASVTESGNILILKVAKGTIATLSALSPAELIAFTAYIKKIKGAGTPVNIISLPADQLRITATVQYDGQYELSEIQTRVQDAIDSFLFNVPFNGIFYKNKMADVIDNGVGIINFDLDTAVIRAVQGVSDVLVGTSYQTLAGYLRRDTANYNITYTPV